MTLEEITNGIQQKLGEDCGVRRTLLLDFGDEGVIYVDGHQVPTVVNNERHDDADAVMKVTKENFEKIALGELNPQLAFLTGKIKLKGDMSAALEFGPALA